MSRLVFVDADGEEKAFGDRIKKALSTWRERNPCKASPECGEVCICYHVLIRI